MKKLTIPEMHRLTPEQFHEAKKLPFVVVLDNVRSVHNVGAVFRTADAFLIEAVYLCGISGCPPNVEMHKTALGAELTVDWRHFDSTLDAVTELHQRGYRVYAVEQAHDSQSLSDITSLPFEGRAGDGSAIAVILGHEVFGVQQSVVDACDGCIEIKQYGTKHSLNVSVTAGIVMHHIATWMRNE